MLKQIYICFNYWLLKIIAPITGTNFVCHMLEYCYIVHVYEPTTYFWDTLKQCSEIFKHINTSNGLSSLGIAG